MLIVNNTFSLEVLASGKNFRKYEYNIIINKLERDNYLDVWNEEINNIEREVDMKSRILSMLKDNMGKFKNNNKIS